MLLCALGFVGVIVYGSWDGVRKGFTFGQFLVRFLVILLGMKAFDIIVLDHEDAVFPALHTGDEGLCGLPQLWLQQEGAVLADRDAAFRSAADSLGLHAVLNTEDGMSHNKRRTEEI